MKILIALIAFLSLSTTLFASPHEDLSGYYLKWDTDHTERRIKPEYKIPAASLAQHQAYQFTYDEENRPQTINFYLYGTPSNASNFGAHQIKLSYDKTSTHRHYFNVDGAQTSSAAGVYRQTYQSSDDGFYSSREHFDQNDQKIADIYGVAKYRILARDTHGRSTIIRLIDLKGNVVPDRFNGFLETRLAFDENDHLTHKKSFDLTGTPILGTHNYHTVYFWYDEKGNRTAEEFRDVSDQLVIPKGDTFARIELIYQGNFGRVVEIRYYKADNSLRNKLPALSKLYYDNLQRLIKRTYHTQSMHLTNNRNGVATYIFSYEKGTSTRIKTEYDFAGKKLP